MAHEKSRTTEAGLIKSFIVVIGCLAQTRILISSHLVVCYDPPLPGLDFLKLR